MLSPHLFRLAVSLLLLGGPLAAAGAEPPIVAKARAYLGTEAALNAVRSIHQTGTMLAPNPADPAKPIPVALELIFQGPYPCRQRTTSSTDALVDTSALDNYDSWHRVQNPKNPSQYRLQLPSAEEIKRQRAMVWENVGFYRGLEKMGGKVLDQGSATRDGVACRKIAFVHAENIIFTHYFDEATGRLVLTETESGGTFREQGEITVNGVRFAKVIVTTLPGPDGKPVTVTVTWDKITVNESFPDSVFAVPAYTAPAN
jgi:hypothetical protein